MSYFDEVYLKRLNRYGNDFQSRIQGQREREFEIYLQKSIYRTNIIYNNEEIPCTLEPYSQNETETFAYLLTHVNIHLPAGEVFMVKNYNDVTLPWMVFYLETMKASGYNRYIMLKMTHYISWKDRDGNIRESWVYMNGQENNMLKDELKSRSRSNVLYTENLKLSFFTMPLNEFISKDDYIELGEGKLKECYVVTGYDRQSTPGVQYVSLDPVYERDLTPAPKPEEGENEDDFFWLNGGSE